MRSFPHLGAVVALLACVTAPARAITVDGHIEPQYGPPLTTQTTQTSLGDHPVSGQNGSELDQAYGFVAQGALHLFLSGNFSRFYSEPLIFPDQVQLYLDTTPGGQNPLSSSNPSAGLTVNLQDMAGLGFDAEFQPDYWIAGAREEFGWFYAHYAELSPGGEGYYLGKSTLAGDGTLTLSGNATNPHGIRVSVDPTNEAGVTGGCGPSPGAGAVTGAEWVIPLTAIGNPNGLIRICVLLARSGGTGDAIVSNQVLGPVPPGTCELGAPGGVNFANIAGAQYFVIDLSTPAVRSTWGRIKQLYR